MDINSEIDCIIVNEASCDSIQLLTDGRLREKHKCIVMKIDEDSFAFLESFKRVECTNWEYRRVRVTHQLPVPQNHWFAVSVW